jgi:hypothetical protein
MSITLITRNDWRVATELINILKRANQVRICSSLEICILVFWSYIKPGTGVYCLSGKRKKSNLFGLYHGKAMRTCNWGT